MDPLSAAASIAGLISLASDVSRLCYRYARGVTHAPAQLEEVTRELTTSRRVLSELEDVYSSRTEDLPSTENILSDVAECVTRLTSFATRIDPLFQTNTAVLSRLKWPFKVTETRTFLAEMSRFRELCESAKSNDSLLLGMKQLSLAKSTASRLEDLQGAQDINLKGERVKAFLKSLSPLEFESEQRKLYHDERAPNTGEWIFGTNGYKQWLVRPSNPILWLVGRPGTGKTIAASVVVSKLSRNAPDNPVVYVFCKKQYVKDHSVENLIGCLIQQMAANLRSRHIDMHNELIHWLTLGERGHVFSCQELEGLFILFKGFFATVWVVIDGLDELDPDVAERLISCLGCRGSPPKVAIFSRPHLPSIQSSFPSTTLIMMELESPDTDIKRFLKEQIHRDKLLSAIVQGDDTFIGRVIAEITKNCEGLFGFAALHIKSLAQQICKDDIIDRCRSMKADFPSEYRAIIERMEAGPQRNLAITVLKLLAETKHSIRLAELCDALAIRDGQTRSRQGRRPPPQVVLACCRGLIQVTSSTGYVEVFHSTLLDFVSGDPIFSDFASLSVRSLMVHYLAFDDFAEPCKTELELSERRMAHPFAAFVSRIWGAYIGDLGMNQSSEAELEKILGVLKSGKIVSSIQLLPSEARRDGRLIGSAEDFLPPPAEDAAQALYISVCLRLGQITRRLLESTPPTFVSPWGDNYTILHAAIIHDDPGLVEALLSRGSQVEATDRWGLTCLHLAVRLQLPNCVQMAVILRNAGALMSIPDQDKRTVLHFAVTYGTEAMVDALFANGNTKAASGINDGDREGNTPLHDAVDRRPVQLGLVRSLLVHGADPNILNDAGSSPAARAIEAKLVSILDLFLSRTGSDGEKATPLTPQLQPEAERIVEKHRTDQFILAAQKLERQGTVSRAIEEQRHERSKSSWSTLMWYAEKGHVDGAEKLLKKGVYVNERDNLGRTALHHAVRHRRTELVLLLLDAGIDPSLADRRGITACDVAKERGYRDLEARLRDAVGWRGREVSTWASHTPPRELSPTSWSTY